MKNNSKNKFSTPRNVNSKVNSENKYRKYPKDTYRGNSENKSFSKRGASSSFDENKKYNSKSKNNYFLKDKNEKIHKHKDNLKNNLNLSKESKFNKKNHEFKETNLEDYIWGKHSVLAALEKNRPVNRIWCTSEIRSSEKFFILLKEAKNKGVLIEEVSWQRISQITRGAIHQGIALQVSFTQTISLEELISRSKVNKTSPILICLDGITDPHNVGAIIRSAEAFGCVGVILPQRRSAGITGTVAKVAAGALEHIAITRVVNLNRSLQALKNEGFLVIGLTEKASFDLSEFKEKAPLVIVVGSENKGISIITQKYCDYLLKIPLKGRTSSLNASVAAGIFINHITKIN